MKELAVQEVCLCISSIQSNIVVKVLLHEMKWVIVY